MCGLEEPSTGERRSTTLKGIASHEEHRYPAPLFASAPG